MVESVRTATAYTYVALRSSLENTWDKSKIELYTLTYMSAHSEPKRNRNDFGSLGDGERLCS